MRGFNNPGLRSGRKSVLGSVRKGGEPRESLSSRESGISQLQAAVAPIARACVFEALEQRRLLTAYYVSTGGNDGNAGTSTSAPWASVAKVDATAFQPGDQILFQSGGEWHGQLTASSSGTVGNPIVYGSYGSGAKPIFDGSDIVPAGAFTLVSGSTYSFNVGSVPNSGGNAFWVYANHAGMLAAAAGDASGGGVQANSNSFYINGTTVYINTGGTNPNTNGVVYTLGDRGAGVDPNSSLINSNAKSNVTFQNILGRETAEVGGGNSLTGGIADGYVYRIQGGANISLLNDEGDYGSKHIVGAINTTGFVANGLLLQGAPEGVAGNNLPYGNATATVAYSDNDTGDTSQWINVTVQNYDGAQPAFLTHGNPNAIASILLQNFVSIGSPIALEPGAGVAITILGGKITDNTLTAYTDTGVTETINGLTVTGAGSAIQVNGNALVENCLLQNSSQSGAAIQVSGPNNTIRFNTIAPYGYASGVALEGNSTNTVLYGNLFTGSSSAITTGGGTTYSADYDFFDSTVGAPSYPAGQETHKTVGNPMFVNTAAGDYSLQSGSAAINTVPTSVVNPALPADIRGYTRPSANVYDAGAYEYQSVLHQPTVATAATSSANPVTGTTTNLSVLGASPDGEATLIYTWSASGPGPVTYSANGSNAAKNTTATFSKAGSYTFTANISNGQYSTTSAVAVTVNQTSQGLTITPSQFFVPINTTQQFTGAVVDQFGNPISGAPVTYSIQSGGGSINGSGLFTAPGTTGTTIIKATAGSSSATATANVVPPNQAPTVATAANVNPNPVTGTTAQLSALGADDNGEGNLTYTWSLVGTPPAAVSYSINGTNAAKNTTATFTANGSYNFLVTIKDSNGLTTTSSVTATVNTFVPIVLDGTKDGRYGSPLSVQTVATNYGNGILGTPAAPYSQLSAAYAVIDQQDNQLDIFIAGSLNLQNAHLDLLIDSVAGQGVANLNSLNNLGPWGTAFPQVTVDSGFRPDHIFTFGGGGGQYLSYDNLDNGTEIDQNFNADPASQTVTSAGGIPYFQERINNAATSTLVAANTGGSLTTGAEFAFSLSGLGYTSANFAANVPIGFEALISYGSHTQATNQSLAPFNPSSTEQSANPGAYYGNTFDLSNATLFPGNQFVAIAPPAGPGGPAVATAAAVNPNPVTGTTAALSVLGSDSAGESTLTYTWSTTGTPPGPVSFSVNGTNASKNTTATFTANGTYNFLVTIQDGSGLTTTSTVTATVTGAGAQTNQAPTVATAAAANPNPVTGTTTALSVLGADDGGEANLTYTWATAGTPPAAVSFSTNSTNASKNTTATFTKAGSYSFQVTIKDAQGLTTTSSVTVTVNQTATSLSVSPTSASVVSGKTQQFVATATDQFGAAIASPALTWSVASGGGTVSTSGLYTAPAAAGSATVKVVTGSLSATAAITITNAAPTVATAASGSPNPVTATTTTLSVLGADDGGEAKLVYTWATTGTPPAAVTFSVNGTNASKTTTATFTKAGSYAFQVTIKDAAGLTTTSAVTVTVNQTATTVTLTPATVTVAPNGTQQFTAAVKDQFAVAIASPAVTWSVSAGTGTINASGLYTAPAAAGSATVKAVSGSASGTASVTVSAGNQAPTVATAAKATPSPVTGTTTALSVLGADDGGEANLVYTWATTGTPPAAVTFSANGTNASKNVTATFTKAGSYTFQVTIKDGGGLTTTSSVTVVVNQTATTVTVSPATASVVANATKQFSASVLDQFGTTIASPSVTWSIVSGSGTINASGLYTAPATAGSASVKATSGGASGTAAVTVTAASGSGVTVDGSLDSSYGSAAVVQSQATNYGNGQYTGLYGNGATAPYSQLSAGYVKIDQANNQLDLFIAGSANLSNAHLDLFVDSVPSAGVTNLNSLANNAFYNAGGFPSVIFDNGFQPDHIFSFSGDGGMYVNYTNLDTGPSSYTGFTEADPANGAVTSNVSGVPGFTIAVNNAQQNNIIAAGAGGSVTTGIEIAFNLSGLGYTATNYSAGVPINVEALISYGSHTIATNQVLGAYTPNSAELQRDGGVYTYFGNANFDFSNNTRFAGNQYFSANPPAVTVDGTLDPRYGTAEVIQSQATNYGNGQYTGLYGNGATAPYSQLSAGYTVIDEAHNQLDLFIAGSANLSNAHLDLFIDSVPGAGVANLNSLSGTAFYNAGGFPSVVFDSGFRPDHIYSFSGDGGMYVNYTNLDTGPSSYTGFSEADPANGVVTSNVNGVPGFTIAVNNAQQNNVIAAGAGGSITTGIELAFNLSALGYSPSLFNSGTPINIEALISYGSHTIGTNQILAPYTPNPAELSRDGGVYTYFGSANFDFSNNTRFAGNQFFSAMPPALYALNIGGSAAGNFQSDNLSYLTGSSSTGSSTDTINTSAVIGPMPTAVYQSSRIGSNFTYTLGGFAAGSAHTVVLGFAETTATGAGQRVFNVTANGIAALSSFDIYASAGGKDNAIDQTFTVNADSNGNIVLSFASVTGLAQLNGLEIF